MLSRFSHDRKKDLDQEVAAFKRAIDDFADQAPMEDYYSYCASLFGVSKECIKIEFKKQISEDYDWKQAAFPLKIQLGSAFKYIVKTFLFFVYVLFRSKRFAKKIQCDLLIEWIESELEAKRFQKLSSYFDHPLLVTVQPIEVKNRSIFRPRFKFYDRYQCLKVGIQTFFFGIWKVLICSFQVKVNLFSIHLSLLDRYLYYTSLFKSVEAKYLLQERHYQTSALKTFLFKKMGGQHTSSIQKNIIHGGYSGFYYDVDHFFSLGEGTYQRAVQQGAQFRKVTPVGSLFMEYSWFTVGGRKPDKVYDVIYLGLNMIDFHNSYDLYLPDYYEHIRWMAKFADKFPEYSVGIKHHANNSTNPEEKKIIDESRLISVPHEFNSYEHAFAAKCTLTWGSTMGYELLGHNIPCLFLDPGRREFGFLPYDPELDPYRVVTYEEFEEKLLRLLSSPKETFNEKNRDFFCLDSEETAKKIWHGIVSSEPSKA